MKTKQPVSDYYTTQGWTAEGQRILCQAVEHKAEIDGWYQSTVDIDFDYEPNELIDPQEVLEEVLEAGEDTKMMSENELRDILQYCLVDLVLQPAWDNQIEKAEQETT